MPSTCFPWRNIEKVLKGVALRLRQIYDTNCKFKIRSNKYQQYLIAKGYKPLKVSKQFSAVAKISIEMARLRRVIMGFKVTSFLTEFNPLLPDLNKLVRNRLPLLHCDPKIKIVFPERSVKSIYKRGKNLKEILSRS